MDLHMHSTYSDGELTPEQLVREAKRNGISMMAITDHDAIEGYLEGQAHARREGITLIPGIELNTDGEQGELHILGYHFDPLHPAMQTHIKWRKQVRVEWGKRIVEKLASLGYSVEWKRCMARASGGVVVRTHIGDELVEQGYFQTSQEAYHKLLRKGAEAFVPREPFCAREAIVLIHQAGGEAYLAHPGIYPSLVDVEKLASWGLDGIEVYHSKHKREDVVYWRKEAERLHLKQSGGSDYHGPNSRNPFPIGSVTCSEEVYNQWKGVRV
ncbi:PHP domain-containing protein [Ammoniphilus sp. CFH 90114]|uniref:PHP domain-containing protein n=1 Tax=Ammoniphilus sp. CFH 90114 TaxID=2493665 RepID=UPI00100DF1E2|nr:PHP domain-containing protein [Ammoniphilus sp. CFH 90114]RXT04352.1 PHP domain-containing protein [Ammoniphilus sp. CFH 90114]